MSNTFTEVVTLEKQECGKCGGVYAITKRVEDYRRENGGFWHCPYCQIGWGYVESEADKLRKKLTAANCEALRQQQLKEQAEREKSAVILEIETLKNRSKNGVCPCCHRTFQQLSRHMKSKHPEFQKTNKPPIERNK